MNKPEVTREQIFKIASAAQCDPRTVSSFFSGGIVRPLLKERIEAAMKKLKVKL